MVFSSPVFLFLFLPVVLVSVFLCRGRYKNYALIAASLLFYAWGEPCFVAIMLCSIGMNYLGGLWVERVRKTNGARLPMILVIGLNLGVLAWFKYSNFFISNINQVFSFFQIPVLNYDPVHLPIGISFFTFQAISYISDVHSRRIAAQHSVSHVALYISLFPQLIAGPIVRYTHISSQIENPAIGISNFSEGTRRFIIGLGKKCIIANPMGELTDQIMALPQADLSPGCAWLGAVAYTLQIYFDFSGYSDMAIGLGKMFGFSFPENFNYPYISKSVKEFWTRWHISLSTWFKDYLYIPMGGNRYSVTRTYINLIAVFFLCGLWHGASWNFIIWGLFHGLFLVIERIGVGRLLQRIWAPFSHVYTLLVVMVGWIFFRCDDLSLALNYLKAMAGLSSASAPSSSLTQYLTVEKTIFMVLALILCMPVMNRLDNFRSVYGIRGRALIFAETMFIGGIFLFSIVLIGAGTYNPFIYFRF